MISVVIPLYNENVLVDRLLTEVFMHLGSLGELFEVVCVDDGSSDSTLSRLLEFKKNNKQLKVVSLSRNFGLQAALTAGLEHVKGEYIIMMDGDFQDPPELIPVLYKTLREKKADIVTAIREQRNEKFTKKLYINIFHKIFSSITEDKQIANAGNFCIMNRNAHDAILKFAERNRYLPGIRSFIGFKQASIFYDRPERLEGEAKMSRKKLFALAADAIYSFSKWPIKLCLYLGITGVFVFLAAIIYTVVSKFIGFAPTGWSSTFLAISFFGSVQLTFLGIIGEYIYRIFKEVQNRPIYFVKEFYE
ncbi:MAG: glycosyltransferase family 2 protein [Prolixibacteraceae bacterium]|nr:glycosyltransferase family 2 protein [Prolixibacteraceae bacterium]